MYKHRLPLQRKPKRLIKTNTIRRFIVGSSLLLFIKQCEAFRLGRRPEHLLLPLRAIHLVPPTAYDFPICCSSTHNPRPLRILLRYNTHRCNPTVVLLNYEAVAALPFSSRRLGIRRNRMCVSSSRTVSVSTPLGEIISVFSPVRLIHPHFRDIHRIRYRRIPHKPICPSRT